MKRLLRSLIVSLALLPALAGCGGSTAEPLPPPSDASLAAIKPKPGVDRQALARRIDALFAKDAPGTTQALIVMRGGEIVAERYAQGFGPETRFQGWSMSKTVTAVLIGLLVSEGRLRLDESAPIPNWQRPGDPRGEITVRQLLQMRSGLRHVETADPPFNADTVQLLFMDGRDDMAAQAEAEPLEAEPGRSFKYSTASSIILSDIIARVLTDSKDPGTRRAAVDAFLHERLLHPLGLKSMVAEYDAAGT
ncbi:MAG: serine hydrolase, partial [Novosphingobium sp.]|nr:serine hydrolase [Novosphingobium sp.]